MADGSWPGEQAEAKPAKQRHVPRIDPQHARFGLVVRPSPIHRHGVFATEEIPAKRRVIEYTGRRIDDDEADRLTARQHVYLFSLENGMMIDGARGGSGAEFINHSCEPNLIAREIRGRIWYSSLRRIFPGEELTVDYRLDSDDQYPCGCGAPACRGLMNAPADEEED